MAIKITFEDFDTLCYSTQYNLMKLIENAVGISVELSLIDITIGKLNDKVDKIDTDVTGKVDDVVGDVGTLEQKVYDIYNSTGDFTHSKLDARIATIETVMWALNKDIGTMMDDIRDLERRVSALEGG